MVSRCDLLRPFLRRDEAISDEIHQDVLSETLGPVPGSVNATVCEGVVTLTGRVAERADMPIVERLCRSVDGVVAVHGASATRSTTRTWTRAPPRTPLGLTGERPGVRMVRRAQASRPTATAAEAARRPHPDSMRRKGSPASRGS
ncbi:BON domain-containing protein [Streptomyces sp. NBC_00390]|uniref:BON domain-containing protein n=1 Tax=Streptomyces sp. NBC_00390 TaxID=2975736 RepID=UPI002E24A515